MSRPRELGREAGKDTNLSHYGSDGGSKTKLRARITKRSASHPSILALLKATPPSQSRERFEAKKPRDSQGSRGFSLRAKRDVIRSVPLLSRFGLAVSPPSVLAFPQAQLGRKPGTRCRKGRCSISCESS